MEAVPKKRIFYLKLFLGLFLIALLIYRVGFGSLVDVLSQAKLHYLLLAISVFLVAQLLGALNLLILVAPLRAGIGFSRIVRIFFLSWSYGLLFPGKLGEFSAAIFLKAAGVNLGKALFVTLLDKIISLVVLLPIAFAGTILLFQSPIYLRALVVFSLVIAALLLFAFSSTGRNFVKRYLLRRYAEHFTGFSATAAHYWKNCKTPMMLNLAITASKWSLHYLVACLFFRAFATPVPFYVVAAVCSLALIIAMVPVSISGLGIFQSAVVVLYGFFGIAANITLSVELINLAVIYSLAAIFITTLKLSFTNTLNTADTCVAAPTK